MGDVIVKMKLKEFMERYNAARDEGDRLTQRDIAALTEIDPATLSRYMNNQTGSANFNVIQRFVKEFKIKDANEIFEFKWEDES